MPRIAVATMIVGSLLCSASAARADESTHDKAVSAFQEGRRYIEQGNCDAAVAKLKESIAYEPSVGARLSIADCTERTEPLTAWRMLKEAASQALLNHDERVATAEQRAALLEKRIATVHLKISPATYELQGFEVRIDGELVDRYLYKSGVVALAPGKHLVEATAPSRRFAENVNVHDGQQVGVNVVLQRDACTTTTSGAAAPASTSNLAEPSDPGSGRRTLGLAIAGAGIAGLASGLVFGLVTLEKKSSIEEACRGNIGNCQAPPESLDSEQSSAKTTAAISTASFIAGGAALLGGAALYFTAPSARTGNLKVAPSIAHGAGGVAFGGTF